MSTVTITLTQQELRTLDNAAAPRSREAFCRAAIQDAVKPAPKAKPKSTAKPEKED